MAEKKNTHLKTCGIKCIAMPILTALSLFLQLTREPWVKYSPALLCVFLPLWLCHYSLLPLPNFFPYRTIVSCLWRKEVKVRKWKGSSYSVFDPLESTAEMASVWPHLWKTMLNLAWEHGQHQWTKKVNSEWTHKIGSTSEDEEMFRFGKQSSVVSGKASPCSLRWM